MAWDGQDQAASVRTSEGKAWHYTYDSFGRRIAQIFGNEGYAATSKSEV